LSTNLITELPLGLFDGNPLLVELYEDYLLRISICRNLNINRVMSLPSLLFSKNLELINLWSSFLFIH
jgi:hypothetical protein